MQAKSIAKRSTVTIKLGEQVSQYERARPGDFVIVVRGGRVFFTAAPAKWRRRSAASANRKYKIFKQV